MRLVGDGRLGYAAEAPYNAIHVGAAADTLPQQVLQLKNKYMYTIVICIMYIIFIIKLPITLSYISVDRSIDSWWTVSLSGCCYRRFSKVSRSGTSR